MSSNHAFLDDSLMKDSLALSTSVEVTQLTQSSNFHVHFILSCFDLACVASVSVQLQGKTPKIPAFFALCSTETLATQASFDHVCLIVLVFLCLI